MQPDGLPLYLSEPPLMAFTSTKFTNGPLVNDRMSNLQGVERRRLRCSNPRVLSSKFYFSDHGFIQQCGKTRFHVVAPGSRVSCWSSGPSDTETEESVQSFRSASKLYCSLIEDEEEEEEGGDNNSNQSSRALAEACKFAYNDARFVNERARNDIVFLSRGIMKLDARARQDVAILGLGFLKLDARAREDTEKIDRDVKEKAERLHRIASILKDEARSRLKSAADKHWSDGALEADLCRADLRAKQRAMEDALMALEFVKSIHDLMVAKMDKLPLPMERGGRSEDSVVGRIMLEKNGKNLDFFPKVSTDRISLIQEAYESMASTLSKVDGIDYTDPEELELLIATLIDLDAMDGKSSVSLLAECSSSPDVSTRQALANALAAAPSMWTLGNAGMGALQRLAEDSNPAIACAASKTIYELKKQWEIEEGDSWRFMMNQNLIDEGSQAEEEDDNDE